MERDPPEDYPRPDFWRQNQQWTSINGSWDFLFDDDDVGLSSHWNRLGLPTEVTTLGVSGSYADSISQSESITANIAENTQKLRQGNLTTRDLAPITHHKRKIIVPYVFQSPASGVNDRGVHEVLWYERRIEDIRTNDERADGHRLLVRFGAVDYIAKVWVDGQYVGGHRGGHVPFDIDITDSVDVEGGSSSEHRLTLRIYDSAYDLTQPRGKQYWGAQPESIFYTPSGGIWQNVWLESVPSVRIGDSSRGTILRSNDTDSGHLHSSIAVLGRGNAGDQYTVEIEARYGDAGVVSTERKSLPKNTDTVNIDIDLRLSKEQLASMSGSVRHDDKSVWRNGLALWSPDYPQLYNLSIRLFDSGNNLFDEIKTTVGMRSLDWTDGDGTFKLNGKPIFQTLFLDQGYWPETFMTPPSSSSLKTDIELAKKMGFNGCRKHQKVEDPRFMYWADRLGYLVWGEMANAYSFSDEYVERFNNEWTEAVKRDINHPCIVAWTPVNESWAYTDLKGNVQQRNHIRALYYLTKTLDPTRPVNDNCGWEHVQTDLTTFHDYSDSPALKETCKDLSGVLAPKAGRPMFVAPIPGQDAGAAHRHGAVVICTELGGVNIALAEKKTDEEWGYTTASDPEDLLERIEKLVDAVVDGGQCSGFVWTQFADIEQETNGLYSFDRKEKLDAGKVKAVMDRAKTKYHATLPK